MQPVRQVQPANRAQLETLVKLVELEALALQVSEVRLDELEQLVRQVLKETPDPLVCREWTEQPVKLDEPELQV